MPKPTPAKHTAETLKRSLEEMRGKLADLEGFADEMKSDKVPELVVLAQGSLKTAIIGMDVFTRACEKALRDWRLDNGIFGEATTKPSKKTGSKR